MLVSRLRVWYIRCQTWVASWLPWFSWLRLPWLKPPPPKFYYETSFPLDVPVQESEENYKKDQVEEQTPSGKVRMKYDEENKCFVYWSDTTIPTRYLDTVARKYVVVFDKRDWYEKTEVEYTERKQANLDGPFVKSKQARVVEIVKKMNRFKKQGGLNDVEIQKVEGRPVSYADFKKMA
jgi:hypothetical protein